MLGLDGMAFDDGVAMRLAEDRYVVTTTTGGAAQGDGSLRGMAPNGVDRPPGVLYGA